jgi:hypothetical protein
MVDSVRAFVATVAADVSNTGPAAWRRHFLDGPAFFMAAEGRLVFPSSDSASRGIQRLTQVITHISLRWGDSLRIDPLAPGLAMVATSYHEVRVAAAGPQVEESGYFTGLAAHGPAGWQFRDAHWSVLKPLPPVP